MPIRDTQCDGSGVRLMLIAAVPTALAGAVIGSLIRTKG
jgi:hypothetical protein